MRLKRLVVQGFKSFKDRTTIHFNDGITGIVGPNGCGKSNIVDALFWAMGEQSAKHLRGDAMKDLIFAGSSKYSPASWAEVTLILDNEEGKHIHIGTNIARPTEIALTRKLYRNGETEYRINNEQARLRDIQEVFMGTGAGAKSYSIIAQGEIDRLIQAKPTERRFIIEEVAGVTRFKARKKESLRKIEQTEANLLRLGDMREGIEKNLKALRQQAERAERAKKIKERIRKNELIVSSHKVFHLLKGHKYSREIIQEKTQAIEKLAQEKKDLEASLAGEREKREEEDTRIENLRYEYGKASETLAALRERYSLLSRQRVSNERELYGRREEVGELEENLEDREEKLRQLEVKRRDIGQEAGASRDLEAMKKPVDTLERELLLRENEINSIKDELNEINDTKGQKNQEVFKIGSALEAHGDSLQDVNEELDALERTSSRFSGRKTSEREVLVSMEKELERIEKEIGTQKKIVEKRSKEVRDLEEEVRKKNADLTKSKLTKESFLTIDYSLEGTKDFLSRNLDGSYEVVGRLIRSQKKYERGVAALLSEVANALFCRDNDDGEFASWVRGNDKGIDFVVTEGEHEANQAENQLKSLGLKNVQSLREVVEVDKQDIDAVSSLLDGYYIVDSLDFGEFKKIPTEIGFRAITTANGAVIVRNQGSLKAYSFVPPNLRKGEWVERNQKIEHLANEIEELELDSSKIKKELERKRQALLSIQEKYESLRVRFVEKKVNYGARKGELEAKEKSQEEVNFRIDILKNRKRKISKECMELVEKREMVHTSLEDLVKEEDTKQDVYEALLDGEEELRHEYKQKKDEYIRCKMGIDSYADMMESIDLQIEDIKAQMGRERERLRICNERVQTYGKEIDEASEELISLKEEMEEVSSDIDKREAAIAESKKRWDILSEQLNRKEKGIRDREIDMNKNEKTIIEQKGKIENFLVEEEKYSRDIFEKYSVDLREEVKESVEYDDHDFKDFADLSSMYVMETSEGPREIKRERFEFVKKFPKELTECQQKFRQYKSEHARLGNINWEAVEEYERQKLKWDFLKAQEGELKRSLEDLEKAIAHIDERSKKRFRTAFEEVSSRFERVFPIVFGGGSAKLEIVGELDSPECGVDIVARPPGKKMQNINLMSGGEKALTAVGLIFSIFLVRPSPFCLLDEVDAPLDDANVGRFNELLQEMSKDSQFILVTHNKKTMESNDTLYGVTMQEPGISKAVSVRLH